MKLPVRREGFGVKQIDNDRTPAWYRFGFGDYVATIVSDGPLCIPGPATVFPNSDQAQAEALLSWENLPTDRLLLQQNALVLDNGHTRILFDTGTGGANLFGDTSGRLRANLEAAGIEPESIAHILVTHPHTDHVWGMTDDEGSPLFSNARVYISLADFEFWTDLDRAGTAEREIFRLAIEGARKNLLAYERNLNFITEEGEEILPGIRAIFTPGHTLGHCSFVVESGEVTLLNLGDVFHHKLQVAHPEWKYWGDIDSDLAVRSRAKILALASDADIGVLAYHFPFPGLGRFKSKNREHHFVAAHMHLEGVAAF